MQNSNKKASYCEELGPEVARILTSGFFAGPF